MIELFKQIEAHLLQDEKPSVYLTQIYSNPMFRQYPFNMLYELKNTEQSLIHHPEGNVWNHTMLVVDEAAAIKEKSKNKKVFMWSALLHDIGKPSTTNKMKKRITAYDHDKVGAELSKEFLQQFTKNQDFIADVCGHVRYHMHILFVTKSLPFADIEGMKRTTDIHEIALLGLCDRLGRLKCNRSEEENNINKFLEIVCETYHLC